MFEEFKNASTNKSFLLYVRGNTWEVVFGGQILESDGALFFFLVVTMIIDI